MALHDPQDVHTVTGDTYAGTFKARILPIAGATADPGLKVAGITLAERQRRQLSRLGATGIDSSPEAGTAQRNPILLIEAGLLADERLVAAFLAEARARGPDCGQLVALGPDGQIGGLGWLPPGSDPWDWQRLADEAEQIDLGKVDPYSPERRRAVPLIWQRPVDSASARKAGSELLAAAQKGCLDWPARFIHPPIENAAVRLLWATPITPNMISLLAFALGLYAAWCFADGALWTGLLIALVVGPIDGIDGKLARTRVEFSRWGDLEHVGDKIVEYLWFAGLAAAVGTAYAWALMALTVCLAFAEAMQGEFYRRLTGSQLDDAGPFERGYRLISGRRNTFFWCLVPFAWFNLWSAGLIMIAVYAALNFFVMQWRFFVRLAEYGRANSATIAANLDATAYGFLGASESGDGEESVHPTPGEAVILPSSRQASIGAH